MKINQRIGMINPDLSKRLSIDEKSVIGILGKNNLTMLDKGSKKVGAFILTTEQLHTLGEYKLVQGEQRINANIRRNDSAADIVSAEAVRCERRYLDFFIKLGIFIIIAIICIVLANAMNIEFDNLTDDNASLRVFVYTVSICTFIVASAKLVVPAIANFVLSPKEYFEIELKNGEKLQICLDNISEKEAEEFYETIVLQKKRKISKYPDLFRVAGTREKTTRPVGEMTKKPDTVSEKPDEERTIYTINALLNKTMLGNFEKKEQLRDMLGMRNIDAVTENPNTDGVCLVTDRKLHIYGKRELHKNGKLDHIDTNYQTLNYDEVEDITAVSRKTLRVTKELTITVIMLLLSVFIILISVVNTGVMPEGFMDSFNLPGNSPSEDILKGIIMVVTMITGAIGLFFAGLSWIKFRNKYRYMSNDKLILKLKNGDELHFSLNKYSTYEANHFIKAFNKAKSAQNSSTPELFAI